MVDVAYVYKFGFNLHFDRLIWNCSSRTKMPTNLSNLKGLKFILDGCNWL